MSATIKYIGRKTDFKGKTLWEIVGNLRNFGVGRVVTRSMFERYPEPSYVRILKVEALPNEDIRKVKVTVEKTFRGVRYPKPATICSTSYKADYRLIPTDEEADYCKVKEHIEEKIVPQMIELPPLLKEFVRDETGQKEPMTKLHFKLSRDKFARKAKDGETPNVQITMGLGKPAAGSEMLYANLDL